MKSFKQYTYLSEKVAGKNTHMMHVEDQVLYGGVKGTRDAILALRSMRDMIASNVTTSHDITIKFDGAPAVFAGEDPTDKKFFVAKKGIFNKDPKVYKSIDDIKADTSGDLQTKLIIAFKELKKLGIKGVLQGDIMFTNNDLKSESHDGVKYVTFHPNTIVYAVPEGTPLAKEIKKAKIGVVWHTSYSGDSFENMIASHQIGISYLKKVPSVWFRDAYLQDLAGKVTLNKKETLIINKALSDAGKLFQKVATSTLREIENNPCTESRNV